MRIDNTIVDPNLSLVLPGGCTGKCKFCFWEPTKGLGNAAYGKRLRTVLNQLPDQFDQISLTGGEPTQSLAFGCALSAIALQQDAGRYQHVVLTTNGSHLHKWLDDPYFLKVVRHINISRHHYDWRLNQNIFGSKMIGVKALTALCDQLGERGIDVTFNAVITPQLKVGHIERYVEFARECGASAVAFRKQHTPKSTLAPTKHEKQFSHHKITHHSACPVCRSDSMIIKGMPVHWKASIFEPSNGLGQIYELILHADGRLTSDWAGEHGVRLPQVYSKRQGREPYECEEDRRRTAMRDIVKSCGSDDKELVGGCKGSANIVRPKAGHVRRTSGRKKAARKKVARGKARRRRVDPHNILMEMRAESRAEARAGGCHTAGCYVEPPVDNCRPAGRC